jgi:Conserved TM helix
MLVGSIGGTVRNAFVVFFAWLPHVVGAIAVLLIGYFVAKLVAAVVRRALESAGLDRRMHRGLGGTAIERAVPRPSNLLARIVFWAIMIAVFSLAAAVLGVAALTAFVGAIWAYLPNVIAAFLIFLVASALAGGIAAVVDRTMGDTSLGRIAKTAAPVLIMAIAVFMILEQLKIATAIVTITYAALIGAIALGSALAFGLGGREVAGEMLRGAYDKGRESSDQMKSELRQGCQNAKQEIADAPLVRETY